MYMTTRYGVKVVTLFDKNDFIDFGCNEYRQFHVIDEDKYMREKLAR